jgi:NitT/TauT family transport system substrate-binding protein
MKGQLRRRAIAVMAVALMIGVAACGGDDGDDGSATATSDDATETTDGTTDGPPELVAGCENGYTDPADLSEDRVVARCEADAPAPDPLPERETVTMSSAFRLEFVAPLLLADSLGEFDKENIDFELVELGFADAAPQLAQGEIDAAIGGLEAAAFNAAHQDLGVKLALGNYWPPNAGDYDVAQTGLWCRADAFSDPANPDFTETVDMTWGSAVGKSSTAIYYSIEMLERRTEEEIDAAELNVQQVPSSDMLTALDQDAIDCGIVLDPLWIELADDPDYVLAATQTPGETLGGVYYGPSLLEERPEVGEAFARAMIRTINTYLNGDYHADEEVVQAIADATDSTPETITRTPSLVFDWEIRAGTAERIQDLFIEMGVITEFDEPVSEDQVIDRSPYLGAVEAP